MCHPRKQVPIGGARDEMGRVVYDSRRSGYEMNVTPESPITRLNQAAARPVTR